ncbi:uncharacterized protein LOC135849063 [Planococcus citri]|uniref:uncharacterized protein LOC135849063 n=1 Tax=Planococcus citri TaxID=170843 RepID=UPI0031F806E0
MEITSIFMYTALAVIFIQMNSISCRYAEMDNLAAPETKPESSQPSHKIISTSLIGDLNIDPLPPNVFPSSTRNILTPEVFSQADPVAYFLAKTSNFSQDEIQLLGLEVDYYFTRNQFPRPYYYTYAAVLTSILKCLTMLHNVRWSIETIQQPTRSMTFTMADISSPHPELSMLFTPDIFADANPPSVVLKKLLEIPENEMPKVMLRLKELMNGRSSGKTVRLCHNYIKYLSEFLDLCNKYALRSLRIRITRMQEFISTLKSIVIVK